MTDSIRAQFPIYRQEKPPVYLDSAATAQRPQPVLDAVDAFYKTANANPHRGIYQLGVAATEAYEGARKVVAAFVHAASPAEIVFTRNATESLNLLAYSWGFANLQPGDTVLVSILEHHSNLLPWQQICRMKGAKLQYLYCEQDGTIPAAELDRKIVPGVKMLALTHVSNVLGMVLPVAQAVRRARAVGALVALDCAQSAPHLPLDVQALGVDFAAFSGHKLYAPMGIGVLWGRAALLEAMPPFLTGGEMIDAVREQDADWAPLPQKFEAGTQNAGGAVGLAAAICWMQGIGFAEIARREGAVLKHTLEGLQAMPHLTVYGSGPAAARHGSIAFNVEDVHPHDVATILDADGVCVRAGHHCAQPLLAHLGLHACCRVSFGVYNTVEDADAFLASLQKVRKWLGYGS